MSTEEQIAALLDPVLDGERMDEIAFADLVDEAVDDLAGRLAAVGR